MAKAGRDIVVEGWTVLFVDPSINAVGWCLYLILKAGRRTDWRLTGQGTYRTKEKGDRRLSELGLFIRQLARGNNVSQTVIEDRGNWTRQNAKSLKQLDRATGAIFSNAPLPELYQWKTNASKRETKRFVESIERDIGEKVSEHCRDSLHMAHRWLSQQRIEGRL